MPQIVATLEKESYTMTTTTLELERGTEWVRQFAFHTGQHVIDPGHLDSGYVLEKARQIKSDTEALLRFFDTFLETGDLAHLADYRGRLEVMAREIDAGAWYGIVNELADLIHKTR
jgi:hypothetical protein